MGSLLGRHVLSDAFAVLVGAFCPANLFALVGVAINPHFGLKFLNGAPGQGNRNQQDIEVSHG